MQQIGRGVGAAAQHFLPLIPAAAPIAPGLAAAEEVFGKVAVMSNTLWDGWFWITFAILVALSLFVFCIDIIPLEFKKHLSAFFAGLAVQMLLGRFA